MKDISECLIMVIRKLELLTEAFNSTSRYLDDQLNIDNTYFDGVVSQIRCRTSIK